MRSGKQGSVLVAGVFLAGALAAASGPVFAADVRGNQKNQGQSGDLCTSSKDCQQKPTALSCVPAGEQSQCQAPPPPAPKARVLKVT